MSVSPGFLELIEDLLGPLGGIQLRRMFSGAGVFCDGVMFAIAMDEALYLKTDEASRSVFEQEGCSPFEYAGKGRRVTTSYWRLPERLLDDPDEFVAWARIAVDVARKGAVAKEKQRRATARKSAGMDQANKGGAKKTSASKTGSEKRGK